MAGFSPLLSAKCPSLLRLPHLHRAQALSESPVCVAACSSTFVLLLGSVCSWCSGTVPFQPFAAPSAACAPGPSSPASCQQNAALQAELGGGRAAVNSRCPTAPARWLPVSSLRNVPGASPLTGPHRQGAGRERQTLVGNPRVCSGAVHQEPGEKGRVWAWCYCAPWLEVAP